MVSPPSDDLPERAEEERGDAAVSAVPAEAPSEPGPFTGPPSGLPLSARIARISREPDTYTGPPPPIHPISEEIARIAAADATSEQPTKPPPPPRRQTMEVQMAWLEVRVDEPHVEQVPTPVASEARAKDEPEFPEEAPTSLRRRPPRVPGAQRTLPPLPHVPTKPPPPPRRMTTEVEMSWVELVDDDLIEESAEELPKLYDEGERREITRVEDAPASTRRIEREKAAALAEAQALDHLEGPPISDQTRDARLQEALATAKRPAVDEAKLAAEAAKKERLSQFLQAVSASIPPGALKVSDVASEPSDADLDKLREEALAARKREQDARDREILEKRRAERVRERVEQEAKRARREQEKREEEERAAALRTGTPDKQLLDLSDIDDEIDNALDAVLGPNLSYPPPAPAGEDE